MLNKGIGMGYVKKGYITPGAEILIEVRNRDIKAQIIKLPFYKV